MNFKQEYIKAAEMLPDRAALDRMKANVMKQVEAPKKKLPIKQISIAGGAVAACAVITVAAVKILPSINNTDSVTAEMTADNAAANAGSLTEVESAFMASEEYDDFDFDSDFDFDEDIIEDADADYEEVAADGGEGAANASPSDSATVTQQTENRDFEEIAVDDEEDCAEEDYWDDSAVETCEQYDEEVGTESASILPFDCPTEELSMILSEDFSECRIDSYEKTELLLTASDDIPDESDSGEVCSIFLENVTDGKGYILEFDGSVLRIRDGKTYTIVGKYPY